MINPPVIVSKAEQIIRDLFAQADIQIHGQRPWDLQIHNPNFYTRVLRGGSLALGESYMDGWWDCESLDQFFYKVIRANLKEKVKPFSQWLAKLKSKLVNMQTRTRIKTLVKKHYDLSSDLYMSFLDPFNQYTCGYFKNTEDLNTAQEQKLDLICKKLMIKSKDNVLDIGCGWGGFAKFAAERYGCHVTGITISDEQTKYAKKICDRLPVTIIKSDYRDFKGIFDKVLVCGMIEHVGYKNYKTLMGTIHDNLKNDGLFLLQTIGRNDSTTYGDPWMSKYIFPNSMLPSPEQITTATEGLFVLEDWHSFGYYYDATTMAWCKNFKKNWDRIKEHFNERFYRMWTYYLLSGAGSFRSGIQRLWQIVFSKNGIKEGYQSIR